MSTTLLFILANPPKYQNPIGFWLFTMAYNVRDYEKLDRCIICRRRTPVQFGWTTERSEGVNLIVSVVRCLLFLFSATAEQLFNDKRQIGFVLASTRGEQKGW